MQVSCSAQSCKIRRNLDKAVSICCCRLKVEGKWDISSPTQWDFLRQGFQVRVKKSISFSLHVNVQRTTPVRILNMLSYIAVVLVSAVAPLPSTADYSHQYDFSDDYQAYYWRDSGRVRKRGEGTCPEAAFKFKHI